MPEVSNQMSQRPACQAAHPSQCSDCTMAYDCARVRSGRTFSWGLVALAVIAVLVLLSRAATGF